MKSLETAGTKWHLEFVWNMNMHMYVLFRTNCEKFPQTKNNKKFISPKEES